MAREYEIIHKEIKDADGVTCYIKTGEIVRCKECIHKPTTNGARYGFAVTFPDDVCPFGCDDGYYNSMPPSDDFHCGYGERKDNGRTETDNV